MAGERFYNPSAFRRDDADLLARVIDRIGFGTLDCNGPEGPLASHLPFLLERADGGRTQVWHDAARLRAAAGLAAERPEVAAALAQLTNAEPPP